MIVSAATAAAALVLSPDPEILVFLGIWLSIWSIGVVFLVVTVVNLWAMVFAASKHLGTRAGSLGAALFMTAFATPFFAGEVFALTIIAQSSPATAAQLVAVAILNVLFFHLLKAPTLLGRRILDKIEGFRMFLAATEADRLQRLYPAGRPPSSTRSSCPMPSRSASSSSGPTSSPTCWPLRPGRTAAAAITPAGTRARAGAPRASAVSPGRSAAR